MLWECCSLSEKTDRDVKRSQDSQSKSTPRKSSSPDRSSTSDRSSSPNSYPKPSSEKRALRPKSSKYRQRDEDTSQRDQNRDQTPERRSSSSSSSSSPDSSTRLATTGVLFYNHIRLLQWFSNEKNPCMSCILFHSQLHVYLSWEHANHVPITMGVRGFSGGVLSFVTGTWKTERSIVILTLYGVS